MKFGTVILCNVPKKAAEKKDRDYDVTNYVNFLKKLCEKG